MTAPGTTVLTISYDGAAFHGFARQPGLATVQGVVESALSTVTRREIEVVGAGRTDAGVHALGQVVSFPAAADDPAAAYLRRAVGALVGPEVVVTEVRGAPQGFSARYDAVLREYRYLLVPGPVPPLAIRERAWWTKKALDLGAMRDGASRLVGEHDFRSFCVGDSSEGRSTVRTIESIDVQPDSILGEHCVAVRVVGRSFLHSMVRIIVGSLVEIGAGKRSPEWMGEALAARHRGSAGITAPPHGLTLWHVSYPEDHWL